MLKLTNVSKVFNGPKVAVRALAEVTLALIPGEFTAIQGPSGCGKTTLLLIAGGLLAPDTGTVEIGGQDMYARGAAERSALRGAQIGFVFQQFHLIPYLTVRDNILVPSVAHPADDAEEHARELIAHFRLGDRADHLPDQLSTGERQRAALARAMLNRPQLILADEPTGNLDRDNAMIVLDYLAEFARMGGAVLLVTHDDKAAARAGRRLTMQAGKIVG